MIPNKRGNEEGWSFSDKKRKNQEYHKLTEGRHSRKTCLIRKARQIKRLERQNVHSRDSRIMRGDQRRMSWCRSFLSWRRFRRRRRRSSKWRVTFEIDFWIVQWKVKDPSFERRKSYRLQFWCFFGNILFYWRWCSSEWRIMKGSCVFPS